MSIITAILLSDELKSRHQRAVAAARPPASGAIGITIMGRAELVLEITRVSWLSAAPASIRA